MNYKDIINNNCQTLSSPYNWWPLYAFHYTNVTNAIGILKEETIYSRFDASYKQLMSNDNASRQVIDMTLSGVTSAVRFYFRPLTPTQYYNEGYKHPSLRYNGDSNANVPVPVFFLFDLEELLSRDETRFSEQSLAGDGSKLFQGAEDFSKLKFEQIYKTGYMANSAIEKKYRQAEIIYPRSFSIDNSLKWIICRNEIERTTLLNLLRKEAPKQYTKYQKLIVVNSECFEHNGLYIAQTNYYEDKAAIEFARTSKKVAYTSSHKCAGDNLPLLNAEAEFEWMHSSNRLFRQGCKFLIDYENTQQMTFTNLQKPAGATALYMKIMIEKKLVCSMCWQLPDSALL